MDIAVRKAAVLCLQKTAQSYQDKVVIFRGIKSVVVEFVVPEGGKKVIDAVSRDLVGIGVLGDVRKRLADEGKDQDRRCREKEARSEPLADGAGGSERAVD